jgi:hypothetical protein
MIEKYISKYTLAQQDLIDESFSHLFVMNHLNANPEKLESLFTDMKKDGSFALE